MGTIGNRLTNPMDLFGKKSVYIKRWRRPSPVTFIVSMQLKEVASLFNQGVFEYTAKDKSNKPSFTEIVQYKI